MLQCPNIRKKNLSQYNLAPFLCIFWIEKIVILIDFFQLFGLIWITAQPWPWPYLWIKWTTFTVGFNLDFFSLTTHGALYGQTSNTSISSWGQLDGYLNHCLAYSVSLIAIYAAVYITYSLDRIYGARYYILKPYLTLVLFPLCYFLYIPMLLPLVRLYYCETNTVGQYILSAQQTPIVLCGSVDHIVYTVVCTLLQSAFLIRYPIALFSSIRSDRLHKNPMDHERQLQIWELLFIYGADSSWLRNSVYLLSSYNRSGAYYQLYMLIYKIVIVIAFIASRPSFFVQSCIVFVSTCAFTLHYGLLYPPFRCLSSNIVLSACLAALLIDASFGAANAFHVTNGITVASVESIWLLTVHLTAGSVILGVLVLCWLDPSHRMPCVTTFFKIRSSPTLKPKVKHWMRVLRRAHIVRLEFMVASEVVADVAQFEEAIRQLHLCWTAAKKIDSLFTSPIGESLEDCLLVHAEKRDLCMRTDPRWNTVYEDCVAHRVFARRRERLLLAPLRTRRLLNLILAVRAFRDGGGKRGTIKVVRGEP